MDITSRNELNELLKLLDEGAIKVYNIWWNDPLINEVKKQLSDVEPIYINKKLSFKVFLLVNITKNMKYDIVHGIYKFNLEDMHEIQFSFESLINLFKKDNIDIEFAKCNFDIEFIRHNFGEINPEDYSGKVPTINGMYVIKFTTSVLNLKKVIDSKNKNNLPTPKEKILNK